MIPRNCPFEETSAQLFDAFFKKHPNDDLRERTILAPLAVLKRHKAFAGKPEGWAAEVLAVYSVGCAHDVLNGGLAKTLGVTMSTIDRRAWDGKRLLGVCLDL